MVGGAENLVVGEQFRPVANALVGGQHLGTVTVAVAGQPEGQRGASLQASWFRGLVPDVAANDAGAGLSPAGGSVGQR